MGKTIDSFIEFHRKVLETAKQLNADITLNKCFMRIAIYCLFISVITACANTGLIKDELPPIRDSGGIITSQSPTPLSTVSLPETTQWIVSGEGVPLGVAVHTVKGMTLSFNDRREFLIDVPGKVVVAEQAKSFVVLSPLNDHASRDWRLAFYDANGKPLTVNDKLHGYSQMAVAANGSITAVAGTLKQPQAGAQPRQRTGLVIYDAQGKERGRHIFPAGTVVTSIAVDPAGSRVAIGLQHGGQRGSNQWTLQLFDAAGRSVFKKSLSQVVQALRFIEQDRSLVVLIPGGIKVLDLADKISLSAVVRLPKGYHIPGAGRVYLRSGKLLAIAEQSSLKNKGENRWYFLAANRGEEKLAILAKGKIARSRRSPAFSMSAELGAEKWPVLVTTNRIMKIDPTRKPMR